MPLLESLTQRASIKESSFIVKGPKSIDLQTRLELMLCLLDVFRLGVIDPY